MAISGNRAGSRPIVDCVISCCATSWTGGGNPPEKQCKALIDTGATHTVIAPHIAAVLNLPLIGTISHTTVGSNTPRQCPQHACDVKFSDTANGGICRTSDVWAIVDQISGYDVILGWDILRFYQLSFDRSGSFCLSW